MDRVDLALRVIGLGFILFALLLIILEIVGVLHSPPDLLIEFVVGSGLFIEFIHFERSMSKIRVDLAKLDSKFDLVWSDFKKRKEL